MYAYCIPITDRTKVVQFIQNGILMFLDVFNKPPKFFVSDNAKEYVSKEILDLLESFNI